MAIDTGTPAELALAFEPAGYEQIPPSTVLTFHFFGFGGRALEAAAPAEEWCECAGANARW